MAQVFIFTSDARLYRILSLLIAECGHEVGENAPSLLITDTTDIPSHYASLPRLWIGEGGLPRPFLHKDFKETLAALLAEDAPPLLTPTERRLYEVLRAASPSVVPREVLSNALFGSEDEDGRLNLYIHYLRKKLEAQGQKRIFAKRGKGYYYADHPTR